MNITPSEISQHLASQCESVVRELLPNGKRIGNEWCVGSPQGEAGESCKVHLTGTRAGLWADFASGGDASGDLLDLWCAAKSCDLKTALDQACKWLGIQRPDFTGHKKPAYKKPDKPEDARSLKSANKVMQFLLSRGLTEKTISAYKVAAKGHDVVMFPYIRHNELIHIKYRATAEKKFWTSADSEKCLFGWQVVDPKARTIIITEGELDAMAMYQYGYAALSVPYGGGEKGKQDWIENEFDNLERFDSIYLAMDSDEAGEAALYDIVDRLGRHRCKVVHLPFKDANECLMKGVPLDAIIRCVGDAKTLDPRELRNAKEYRDAIIRRFHPVDEQARGFLLPWQSTTMQFTFGWGETTIIAGYNGHGKSELVGQVVIDAIAQKVKACVASLEFKPDKWLARNVRQTVCRPDPDISRIDKALDFLGEGLWAFDVSGRGMGTAKMERLLEVFLYARARYGCRLFVIDNFTKLGIAEDDYNGQKQAIINVTEFAVEHDVHVIVVAHMRKGEDDKSAPGKLAVRGAGAITDLPDNLWAVWRNRNKETKLKEIEHAMRKSDLTSEDRVDLTQQKDKLLEQADTGFYCEKYRNGEEEPRVRLWFDKASHQFMDSRDARPRGYA